MDILDRVNAMDTIEVCIHSMVYGGSGLGCLPDGKTVFVPYVLPGEVVSVKLNSIKRGYARADLVKVLSPSPNRIQAHCPHFGDCGGCHYQHIIYDQQLEIKFGIIREQLFRITGITDPPIQAIVPSPTSWNYRNSVQFHLSSQGKLGFHANNSHRVVEIADCHIISQGMREVWPQLEFQEDLKIHRLELREGSDEEILMVLEGDSGYLPEVSAEQRLSIVYLDQYGPVVLAGDEYLLMQVEGEIFKVSAASFFQVNTPQAAAMVRYLLEVLPISRTSCILDLYCGAGLFSKFLARRAGRLVGVEISSWACEDFASNLDEFDHVELYQGDAEHILPTLDFKVDIVLADPPRAGLAPKALEALVRLSPQIIAYISCDPSTLARDAKKLIQAGYTLLSVKPFDLFPQTYHIESITLFGRL